MSHEEKAPSATTMESNDAKSPEGNKPTMSFRYPIRGGTLSVSLWRKEIQVDGKELEVFSVSCQRSYWDGDAWKHTTYFRGIDLLTLRYGVEKALDWIMERRALDAPF